MPGYWHQKPAGHGKQSDIFWPPSIARYVLTGQLIGNEPLGQYFPTGQGCSLGSPDNDAN